MNTNMTGFLKSLCPCALDGSSLSIGRVNRVFLTSHHGALPSYIFYCVCDHLCTLVPGLKVRCDTFCSVDCTTIKKAITP